MYSVKVRHCRESECKDPINYVDEENENEILCYKETFEQYLEKRDVQIDKKEELEAMLSNIGKTQRIKYKIRM